MDELSTSKLYLRAQKADFELVFQRGRLSGDGYCALEAMRSRALDYVTDQMSHLNMNTARRLCAMAQEAETV